jgi:hypothetical protein
MEVPTNSTPSVLEKLTIAYHLTGLLGSAERSHEHYAHRISVRAQAATLPEARRAT